MMMRFITGASFKLCWENFRAMPCNVADLFPFRNSRTIRLPANQQQIQEKLFMRSPAVVVLSLCLIALAALALTRQPAMQATQTKSLVFPGEQHLANIKQLTFEGENAEAYFSRDGKRLIFQRATKGDGCDQIFSMNLDGSDMKMLSNGDGKTTCAYFTPDNKSIVYASTYLADKKCPPKPDMSKGYVWALYPGFDLIKANLNGSNPKVLAPAPRYDAEATIRADGKIVFTSLRSGDLEIWTMDKNGKNLKRLTNTLGYDGGPFWSWDGKWIVYRAHHPETDKEKADYTGLLKEDMIRPTKLDLWIMDENGNNKRRVTTLNKASFAPFVFPTKQRIIFSSNINDARGRDFDLYAVDFDGQNLERITTNDTFDGFPMFSPDGKKLVFCSNRNQAKAGDTNVFIADWVE
jgi:Tol biopolymer transport system component